MEEPTLIDSELLAFSRAYDADREDKAVTSRGEFIQTFPLSRLENMTLDDYIIGKNSPSFCTHVEVKTKAWAVIQGSTAIKFGIYYGKTKSDQIKKYRFSKKFGMTRGQAYSAVKKSLLSLIVAAENMDFETIDRNPLSQMFKAKIISLYYPEQYLNVCSQEHIEHIALELNLPDDKFTSEYQHLLYLKKAKNKITKKWNNPKFMMFLYAKFIRQNLDSLTNVKLKNPKKKSRRKVNFGDIQAKRDAIGEMSEQYALEWEQNRLIGLGYEELVKNIDDRHEIPSYGYDFLSFSKPGHKRYIEVKSLGYDRQEKSYRFFLSENERDVSLSTGHGANYYFYLVLYDSDGKPKDLLARKAEDVYSNSEIEPCAYRVRFDLAGYKV